VEKKNKQRLVIEANMKKMRILITGAGQFALNWCTLTGNLFENIVVSKTQYTNFPAHKFITSNLDHSTDLKSIIIGLKPHLVINSVAMTDVKKCNINKNECESINFKFAVNLAELSDEYGIKLIQLSTDNFSSKPIDIRSETVMPIPENEYGRTKMLADEIIRSIASHMVVRTNFFGWVPNNRSTSYTDLYFKLTSGQIYHGWNNIFFTPMSVVRLIEVIADLIKMDYCGIINASGNDNISKYGFAQIVARKLLIDPNKIISTPYLPEQGLVRPKHMGLNNLKLQKLMPNLDFSLDCNVDLVLNQLTNGEYARITKVI
jgi:dTDP-4-dehydrorhamnose reductase